MSSKCKMGKAKKSDLEEKVHANFRGETSEVGQYLAMAKQAQRQGYPEIAEVLKTIAWEEAEHAARFAELNDLICGDIRENLQMMLNGELNAQKGKADAVEEAQELNKQDAAIVFTETSRDEGRHAAMLRGLISRFFPGEQCCEQ